MIEAMRFTVLGALAVSLGVGTAWAEMGKVREFELTYAATVERIPDGAKEVDIWIPFPVSDEHQSVEVSVDSPYATKVEKEAEFGNSMLHIRLESPKERAINLGLKVKVRRSGYSRTDFGQAKPKLAGVTPELEQWLQGDELVPLSERIRAIAVEVTKDRKTDAEKARAIYNYVIDNMKYDKTGSGWGHGDIYWACDAKRGNCTDFHALFIGLARSVGIPAKFAIGFPIPEDRGEGEIGGYHCWSEFYLDGYGWVPVDASEAGKHPERRDFFFGSHDENRVQFTIGRDVNLAPRQHGKPLNFFIYPYVEVDGKPFSEGVSERFGYRDLQGKSEAANGGR